MLGLQPRRALQRHGPADEDVRGLDLAGVEAQMPQQVEARIGQLRLGDADIVEALFGLARQSGDLEATAGYREALRTLRGG